MKRQAAVPRRQGREAQEAVRLAAWAARGGAELSGPVQHPGQGSCWSPRQCIRGGSSGLGPAAWHRKGRSAARDAGWGERGTETRGSAGWPAGAQRPGAPERSELSTKRPQRPGLTSKHGGGPSSPIRPGPDPRGKRGTLGPRSARSDGLAPCPPEREWNLLTQVQGDAGPADCPGRESEIQAPHPSALSSQQTETTHETCKEEERKTPRRRAREDRGQPPRRRNVRFRKSSS